MDETISVRIPREELKEIDSISKYVNLTKSAILRDVLMLGVKQKMLDIALEKFQRNEATAWKAARIADIPLTRFLDILSERGIEFHYTKDELKEDIKNIDRA